VKSLASNLMIAFGITTGYRRSQKQLVLILIEIMSPRLILIGFFCRFAPIEHVSFRCPKTNRVTAPQSNDNDSKK
jgi:hypothetical protein